MHTLSAATRYDSRVLRVTLRASRNAGTLPELVPICGRPGLPPGSPALPSPTSGCRRDSQAQLLSSQNLSAPAAGGSRPADPPPERTCRLEVPGEREHEREDQHGEEPVVDRDAADERKDD